MTFAPVKRKTLEINGDVYEVLPSELEIAEMVSEFEKELQRMGKKYANKKPGAGQGELKDVCDIFKMPVVGVEKMLGEGALAKIMGGASVPFAKATEVFERVSSAVLAMYEADNKKLYE